MWVQCAPPCVPNMQRVWNLPPSFQKYAQRLMGALIIQTLSAPSVCYVTGSTRVRGGPVITAANHNTDVFLSHIKSQICLDYDFWFVDNTFVLINIKELHCFGLSSHIKLSCSDITEILFKAGLDLTFTWVTLVYEQSLYKSALNPTHPLTHSASPVQNQYSHSEPSLASPDPKRTLDAWEDDDHVVISFNLKTRFWNLSILSILSVFNHLQSSTVY